MALTVNNVAGSLGDWLSLTPLLRANPGSTVIAPDAPHTRLFAAIYEGLADVRFVEPGTISPTPETQEELPFSERVLHAHDIHGISAIPYIVITDAEKDWARDLLKDYPNPIVFNNTTASANRNEPDISMANWRRLPDAMTKQLVNILKRSNTVLRFGTKTIQEGIYDNYDEIDGVINIPDLSLRQLAACYSVIGRYVGTVTGDMHLALSVGCQCDVFTPESTWFYNHKYHHYIDSSWAGDPVRLRYHIFRHDPYSAKTISPSS